MALSPTVARQGVVAIRFSAENGEAVTNAFNKLQQDGTQALGKIGSAAQTHFGHVTTAARLAQQAMQAWGGMSGFWADDFVGKIGRVIAIIGPWRLAMFAAGITLGKAVQIGRDQLREMVDIAERSGKTGVSPELFQSFMALGKGAKEAGRDIETALGHAFEATKEKWGESNPVLRTLMEIDGILDRMVSSQFFAAGSQDDKIRIVLQTMRQLEEAGLRVAAIDLGEKMFGSQFADKIRLGKQSISEIVTTVEKGLGSGALSGDFFSNETVRRAAELDDRLKDAWRTIDQNLKPAWDGLADATNLIKSVWVNIVELMEKASRIGTVFSNESRLAVLNAERAEIQRRLDASEGSGLGHVFGLGMSAEERARRERQIRTLDEQIARLTPPAAPPVPAAPEPPSFAGGAPTPRSDPRKKPEETKRQLDQIEAFINAMQRSNEVLEAELSTQGLSNAAREKAIALARAEAAARAAGRDLTADERAKVLELAGAHAVLEGKLRDVQQAQREAAETARYFGNLASDALADMTVDGRSAEEVMEGLRKTLMRAAIQALLLGQGPLAWLMGMQAPASAGPNVLGGLLSFFGSRSAAGNVFDDGRLVPFRGGGIITRPVVFPLAHGAGLAGEAGPEAIVPLSRLPDGRLGVGAAGGGAVVQIINQSGLPLQQSGKGTPTDPLRVIVPAIRNELLAEMMRGQGLAHGVRALAGNRNLRG